MSDISGQRSRAEPPPDEGLLPVEYLAHLCEVTARFGVRSERLLRDTALDPLLLERASGTIPRTDFWRATERALALTGEPGLGFHFGLALKLSSHGPLGLLAMTSATLRDALLAAERFMQLRAPAISFHTYSHEGVFAVEFAQPVPEHLQVFCTEAFLTMLLSAGRSLVGRGLSASCEIAYAEPAHFSRFSHLLQAPVRFAQPAHRLLLPLSSLDHTILTSDSVTARRVERECQIALAELGERASFLSKIRRDIARAGKTSYPSLEDVAVLRGVSTRTLKRRLAEHGTSFRLLLEEHRREHALRLLSGTDHTVERIAELLGYSERASFHRAFRRWMGSTPERYRRASGS